MGAAQLEASCGHGIFLLFKFTTIATGINLKIIYFRGGADTSLSDSDPQARRPSLPVRSLLLMRIHCIDSDYDCQTTKVCKNQ